MAGGYSKLDIVSSFDIWISDFEVSETTNTNDLAPTLTFPCFLGCLT